MGNKVTVNISKITKGQRLSIVGDDIEVDIRADEPKTPAPRSLIEWFKIVDEGLYYLHTFRHVAILLCLLDGPMDIESLTCQIGSHFDTHVGRLLEQVVYLNKLGFIKRRGDELRLTDKGRRFIETGRDDGGPGDL